MKVKNLIDEFLLLNSTKSYNVITYNCYHFADEILNKFAENYNGFALILLKALHIEIMSSQKDNVKNIFNTIYNSIVNIASYIKNPIELRENFDASL
jgi:hypothetical protein